MSVAHRPTREGHAAPRPGVVHFTSESVTEGHPDKVADQISDGVLDHLLAIDPAARVACETLVARDLIVLAGEISCADEAVLAELEQVARDRIRTIGYTEAGCGFDASTAELVSRVSLQSRDIARGVDQAADDSTVGAGDQGLMFGY